MPSDYYTYLGKEVYDNDVARADDLNTINTAVDAAFEQVETDMNSIVSDSQFYSERAQEWAENPYGVEVMPGQYSSLHWATEAADSVSSIVLGGIQFDSVTDMIAETLIEDTIYQTRGYHNPGDGGHGKYLIVSGDTSDGYINLSVNGGEATAVLQIEGDLKVKQGGAKGDNITDDTTAVQAAVNYCISNSKDLLFTSGTYLVQNIQVTSSNNFTIRGTGGAKVRLIYGAPSQVHIFRVTLSTKFTLVNLILEGTSDSSSTYDGTLRYGGVLVNTSSFISIHRCVFTKFSSYGIYALNLNGGTYTEGIRVTGCLFVDSPYDSTSEFQCGIILGDDGEYSVIDGNWFFRIPAAIRFTDGANSIFTNNIVMKCNGGDDTLKTDRACVYAEPGLNSGKLTISNNKINHNETGQVPIILRGDPTKPQNGFLIEGNDILVNGGTNQNYAIILYDAPNSRISNNQIRPVNNTSNLITLNDSENCLVSGNNLRGGLYGIACGNNGQILIGNYFKSQVTGKFVGLKAGLVNKCSWVGRINSSGVITNPNEFTNEGWSVSGSGGTYVITHDIGDTDYGAFVQVDNSSAANLVTSIVRSATNITIYIRLDGVLSAASFLVYIVLPSDHDYLFQ